MPIDDLTPDEVLALQFDVPELAEDLAAWCGGYVERFVDVDSGNAEGVIVWVPTHQGDKPARLGSWIVRDETGAFTTVARDDFTAHYQPAEAPGPRAED